MKHIIFFIVALRFKGCLQGLFPGKGFFKILRRVLEGFLMATCSPNTGLVYVQCLCIYVYIHIYFGLSMYLSTYLPTYLSVLSVFLSAYLSIYLSAYICVYTFTYTRQIPCSNCYGAYIGPHEAILCHAMPHKPVTLKPKAINQRPQ